jgi:hypothetical protein
VPIKQIRQNPSKLQPVGPALQALLPKSQELKDFAQRALIAYLRWGLGAAGGAGAAAGGLLGGLGQLLGGA